MAFVSGRIWVRTMLLGEGIRTSVFGRPVGISPVLPFLTNQFGSAQVMQCLCRDKESLERDRKEGEEEGVRE